MSHTRCQAATGRLRIRFSKGGLQDFCCDALARFRENP
ncbi:hypothetical protein DM50_2525 [Burkholderia mallei]|nr:hypothetical protein DM50_2525 [Burkholderia mallei]